MPHIFAVLVMFATLAGAAVAGDASSPAYNRPWLQWSDTVKAPTDASAYAHTPQYSDKVLWPHVRGKEAYVAEQWTAARMLTWAKPGENGEWAQASNGPDCQGTREELTAAR